MKSKYKILLLLAIVVSCLTAISCGPKKKVTKFEKPKSILFAKSSFGIPVYKKMESKDKPVGEIKEADLMTVNAQIEITLKDKSIVTYFEIKCPPKFKEGCGENEAYINGTEILGSSLSDINSGQVSYAEKMGKAILVESDLINDAATTRDWITNPAKKDKVTVISDALFLAIAALVKNADDRSQILSELLMVGELVKDPAYTDSRYDLVFKKYALYINDLLNRVHNLKLEVIWTFIPIFIVLELIFPSLSLIADDEISNKASLHTVNVIGNQWYWTYELNTVIGNLKQVSNLLLIDEIEPSNKKYARLLGTTNAISIPVGLKTSFFITSNDVAHSWAIQGLGIKVDAIPGRINLKTVIVSKIGLYTGMCSELCGIEHGFMPISLQVLTLNNWGYNLENMSEKVLTYVDVKNIWQI